MIIFGEKLFENPIKIIKAFNYSELIEAFKEIELLKKKFFLVGYIRYEALKKSNKYPLLYFEVFTQYQKYKPDINLSYPKIQAIPKLSFNDYSEAVSKIKEEISNGNTYEVNYTYDFEVQYQGNDIELFEYLLQKQKTPYNFYIKNEYDTILSFSPELFFTLKNNHIVTKPMKGTIKRGLTQQEDKKLIEFLQNDIKNRAENVMIVDLLRNDLGRIAKTGSVKVTKLFEIETHKTLHQMTSQIEADLKDNTTLFEIFKSIFPCGSITGAPKISTMNIIEEVEQGERDIYCGAIGMISDEETTFSVPIRILQKKSEEEHFRYRVGGAIVWDSQIQDEWEETLVKTKFLNEDFKLIETIKIEDNKLILENEHLNRMQNAAEHFGFKYQRPVFNIDKKDGILRVLLNKNGDFEYEIKPLCHLTTNKIRISPIIINSKNEFLYYKTTYRPYFYDSLEKINNKDIFDEIFFNEKGELTEGSRSNIILQIDDKLYTPPVSCGLLNGVLRQKLVNDGKCLEKVLYKSDLINAQKIFCINSVRGIVEVKL